TANECARGLHSVHTWLDQRGRGGHREINRDVPAQLYDAVLLVHRAGLSCPAAPSRGIDRRRRSSSPVGGPTAVIAQALTEAQHCAGETKCSVSAWVKDFLRI